MAERRRAAQQKAVRKKKTRIVIDNTRKSLQKKATETLVLLPDSEAAQEIHLKRMTRNRSSRSRIARRIAQQHHPSRNWNNLPASKPSSLSFQPYLQYIAPEKTIKVCHAIESLGLGGAQTMMLELVNGLNSYYGEHIENYVVCVNRKLQKSNKLYESYGINPDCVTYDKFKKYVDSRDINIVVHHRISNSKCLKNFLSKDIKYILINHTWHALRNMPTFLECDYYVSVCKFLDRAVAWLDFIHPSRKLVVLNGIEDKYLEDIEPAKLKPGFKTGRCHRMVGSKFRLDSLSWMQTKVKRSIPDFTHHLIGTHKQAKIFSKKYNWFTYHGTILDRKEKMSILKALDVYFYETFQDEGASVAILEALACGVPVITKGLGGCPELVINGRNGMIVKDRQQYLIRLQQLAGDEAFRADLSQKTRDDFIKRLHVKHTACKYMQIFDDLIS